MRIITTATTLMLIAFHSSNLLVSAGWVLSAAGQSCTDRCLTVSGTPPCDATQPNLVTNAEKIRDVYFQVTGNACTTSAVPTFFSGVAPYVNSGTCAYRDTVATSCDQYETGVSRLCCCAAAGMESMLCPLVSASAMPSLSPSRKPSAFPSRMPSRKPSAKPSRKPSAKPSKKPSAKPSVSRKPSSQPSRPPIAAASAMPSRKPSRMPSRKPSSKPSRKPSAMPSTYFDTCFGVDIPVIGLIFKLICLILSIFR